MLRTNVLHMNLPWLRKPPVAMEAGVPSMLHGGGACCCLMRVVGCVYTHTQVHTHTHTRVSAHTLCLSLTHTRTRTRVHAHTLSHTRIYTHIHTHTHTCFFHSQHRMLFWVLWILIHSTWDWFIVTQASDSLACELCRTHTHSIYNESSRVRRETEAVRLATNSIVTPSSPLTSKLHTLMILPSSEVYIVVCAINL